MRTARRSVVTAVCSLLLMQSLSSIAFADRRDLDGDASRPSRRVSLSELEALLQKHRRKSRHGRSTNTALRAPSGFRQTRPSSGLVVPVSGVAWHDLRDTFGDPRSGGRSHMGIDIFAPRWTEVLAVAAGTLTAIDFGERSGRSLWLIGHGGHSYFYAHLQDWAKGLYEGKRVTPGQLIGYVGNTGNASAAPTHLHFEIRDNGRAVNPYPVLARAEGIKEPIRVARGRGSD